MLKHLTYTLLLNALLWGCGEQKAKLSATSGVSQNATKFTSSLGDASQLSVSIKEQSLLIIGHPTLKFSTVMQPPVDAFGKKLNTIGLKFKVTILAPDNSIMQSIEKENENADWNINLVKGDGLYTITTELLNSKDESLKETPPIVKKIYLDTTAPSVKFNATFSAPTGNGEKRDLTLTAAVSDISKTTCAGTIESNVSGITKPKLSFEVKPTTDTTKTSDPQASALEEITYSLTDFVLPEDFPNTVLIYYTCEDAFGLKTENYIPASIDQPMFGLQVAVAGGHPGIPYENIKVSGAKTVNFLPLDSDNISGKLSLQATLYDRTIPSMPPINSAVVDREKTRLLVYISNFAAKEVNELEPHDPTDPKQVYANQPFGASMDFNLLRSLKRQQSLYVTLTQKLEKDKSVRILASIPIDVYIETVDEKWDLQTTWVSQNQFIPAKQDAEITLKTMIKPKGNSGPQFELSPFPKVEYTENNDTWNEISSTNWNLVSDQPDVFEFKIKYPFPDERPFRLRVKAKTIFGNEVVSGYSKNIIAPPTYAIPTTSPCNGYGISPQLASKFLCVRKNPDGTSFYFLWVTLVNTGNAPVPATSLSTPGNYFSYTFTKKGGITSNDKVTGDSLLDTKFVNNMAKNILLGPKKPEDFKDITSILFEANNPTCAATPKASFDINTDLTDPLPPFECD